MSTKRLRPVRSVFTGDRLAQDAQLSAQESARRLNLGLFANAILISAETGKPANSGLQFTAGGARSFAHGLGRKAVGFVEVYGVDAVGGRVSLRSSTMPPGLTSLTHITVTPTNTGVCFIAVF
jgi:hypothetical protein